MKIGILGYGRMGRAIEQVALNHGHEISTIFDIDQPFSSSADMKDTEVLIDFTLGEAVPGNLRTAAAFGLPVVEGTTGWHDKLNELQQIENLTMIHSPNFSIGVYQFTQLITCAAKLMGKLSDYDCYLHELHHSGKVDSPSGTAKKLADILVTNLPGKRKAFFETSHRKIAPDELHVTSTRAGRIPGTHEVGFDSPYDFIQLTHQAHGREGFAYGAVRAAEWIVTQSGIFTMDDFMNSI